MHPVMMYVCALRPALYFFLIYMTLDALMKLSNLAKEGRVDIMSFLGAVWPIILLRMLDMFAMNMTVTMVGKERIERMRDLCVPPWLRRRQ